MTAHFTGTSGTPDSTTSYFMGGAYEVKDSAVKKYYSIAGMTVAMHDGTALQYLLTDHLGSTVAVTNSSGTLTSQQRYLPFGAVRSIPNSPILATDFGYTGQRKLDDGMGGIMDYKARFYSPYLNHFLQPDNIIPDPGNPQTWNRYSYVVNRPIIYNDPSGNTYVCGESCEAEYEKPQYTLDQFAATLGITFSTGWDIMKKVAVLVGAYKVGKAIQKQMNLSAEAAYQDCLENVASPTSTCSTESISVSEAFKNTYGSVYFQWETGAGSCGAATNITSGGCTHSAHKISFWSMSGGSSNDMSRMIKNVVHEFGHAYNNVLGGAGNKLPYSTGDIRENVLRPNEIEGRWDWQQHPPALSEAGWSPSETFGDIFIAWAYDAWNTNADNSEQVSAVNNWMNGLVPKP